ncbi:SLC13 family permease [Marivibrio halodurans]|uniref:SLC13 family permease n=1 Tax=Marivibrio halodurans TaxID=2039722 RepID=A0A8J7V3G6_9PROT|nr:SLC13 family permease [Marivibrio halodurans]MBP5857922.1 SLC13 family permease [Marivibrio halodurans]
MTLDQCLILGLLALLLCFFAWGRWRYDLVAMAGLLAGVLLGLVPAEEAFQGFGHPATVTVALVLILSRALAVSGAIDGLARLVQRGSRGVPTHVASLSGTAALLSGFMNNVGALALLLPVALQSSRKAGFMPGPVLMPLAFASILGGLVTLIGTPPNILVSSFRDDALGEGFAMFDFAPVGGAVMLVGVLYLVTIGWRLVPAGDNARGVAESFEIENYLSEVRIPKKSGAHGRTVAAMEEEAGDIDIQVVALIRRGRRYAVLPRHEPLQAVDVLTIEGTAEEIDRFVDKFDLEVAAGPGQAAKDLKSGDGAIMEAVVSPGARVEGRTVEQLRFGPRHGVTLLGLSRHGRPYRGRLRKFRLQVGDVLLLQGHAKDLPDVIAQLGCLPLAERALAVGRRSKGLWALGLFAAAVAAAALGVVPITIAFGLAALGVVLVGVLSPRELYQAIEWPVIVLLGALIPIGHAMDTSGATSLIATGLIDLTDGLPAWVLVTVLLVVTMTLSDVLNNAATAVVMAPIAVTVAQTLGVPPDGFLMAVALGASCAFLTPIGHQNNALIMGPGGYRFGDYWRVGLPLEALIVAVGVPMILWVWPVSGG